MTRKSVHTYDEIAEELADYIESSIEFISEALMEEGKAPFEAQISESDRLAYFRKLLWEEDGTTPNAEGRQFLIDNRGLDEFTRIYRWVEGKTKAAPRGSTRTKPQGSAADIKTEY